MSPTPQVVRASLERDFPSRKTQPGDYCPCGAKLFAIHRIRHRRDYKRCPRCRTETQCKPPVPRPLKSPEERARLREAKARRRREQASSRKEKIRKAKEQAQRREEKDVARRYQLRLKYERMLKRCLCAPGIVCAKCTGAKTDLEEMLEEKALLAQEKAARARERQVKILVSLFGPDPLQWHPRPPLHVFPRWGPATVPPQDGVAGECYGRAGMTMGCRRVRYPSLDDYDMVPNFWPEVI